MNKPGKCIWPFLAAAVACVIFYSSSMPGEESGEASLWIIVRLTEAFPFIPLGEETLHFLLRKGAHFTVFLVFAFCAAHGLKYYMGGRRLFLSAWGIGALYGVLDEIHQYFVPGRACLLSDMMINAAGAAMGAAAVAVWLLYRKRHIVEGNAPSAAEGT
jgi:VanZ family protein